jgi:pimeloyl-ACP methyl ester carboxylesterase
LPYVTRGGVRLTYDVAGTGPWLTLLHGLTQHGGYWSAQVEALAAHYRLLTIDLRGHGRSDAPAEGFSQLDHAEDVLAVLDALDIRATHLWGTHTGAAVGLQLAADQPERIASLALEGAVIPGRATPSVEWHTARARELAASAGVDAARGWWCAEAEWFTVMRREPEARRWLEQQALVASFSGAPWLTREPPRAVPDLTPRLGELRQQALLINGAEDLPDFLETAALLERALPHARRYLIPGAGAFPAWEAPRAVNPVVRHWLEEID